MEKNPLSFQLKLNPDDFLPATDEEKESLVVMRDSVSFWKDGFRRLRKNKVAMVCLFIIIIVMIFAFIVPAFYPYSYEQQIQGANNLAPMQYSAKEMEQIAAGEKVFPHFFGTDKMGRDYAIRVMMGSHLPAGWYHCSSDHSCHRFYFRFHRCFCRRLGRSDHDAYC